MRVTTRAALALSVAIAASGSALANTPPPGALLDLNGSPLVGATYSQFSTTFTATAANTVIAFAFQDDPGYLGFDNASVSAAGGPNLLVNSGFETGNTSGWTTFQQPGTIDDGFVTKSFAGLTPASGSYFWVDGATNGYDGLQQTIATTIGATYTIAFDLAQIDDVHLESALFSSTVTNSGTGVDGDAIDALVYAQPLTNGPSPIPEPQPLVLLASGLTCAWLITRSRETHRSPMIAGRIGFPSHTTACDFTKN